MPEATFEELIEAMKAGAGILQERGVPFILGGGLAAWARGGPKTEHDVDFLVKLEDADAALEAFESAGWETERAPEGWLYKAWHENGGLIDLIFNPSGGPITDEIIERAPVIEVMALRIPVFSLEEVMTSKLLAINEQEPDFGSVLELARAPRADRLGERAGEDRGLAVREGVLHPRRGAGNRRAGDGLEFLT